jgi:hypothetical protein
LQLCDGIVAEFREIRGFLRRDFAELRGEPVGITVAFHDVMPL